MSSYPIDQTEYRKVMDEIIELSAALDLGEVVSQELLSMKESGAGIAKVVRDFVPAMVTSEENIVFRLYPSEGLIGVLDALRAKHRDFPVG